MPNRFLASGSYGCVYYPGYDCNGKKINNKDYVTKLVENISMSGTINLIC